MSDRIHLNRAALGVCILLLSLCLVPTASLTQTGDPALAVGTTIERELAGGQIHVYQLSAAGAAFVKVLVEQKGIDVEVRAFAPDGKQLTAVDTPNGTQGPELVVFAAESSGAYRVEVISPEKTAQSGRYEIKLLELRLATEADKDRITALSAYAAGMQLALQSTKASRDAAIAKFNQALTLYQSSGDRREEAATLYWLGYCHQFQFEIEKAIGYYSQSLSRYQALNEAEDKKEQGKILPILAYLNRQTGNYIQAASFLDQSLALRRAINDRTGEVDTLNNLGDLYGDLGEFQQVLAFSRQAIPLARNLAYPKGEYRALSNISNAFFFLGEWQKALDHNFQMLPLLKSAGDRATEAVCLNNIGFLYNHTGDWQKALDYFEQALPLYRRADDVPGQAAVAVNIGNAFFRLNNLPKALESFEQSLSLARLAKRRDYEATALNNIGRLKLRLGALSEAAESFNQSLTLRRGLADKIGEANSLDGLADVYRQMGDAAKERQALTQALSVIEPTGHRLGQARILKNLARLERDQGRLSEARTNIERAISLLEFIRAGVGNQDLQTSFFASVTDFYDLQTDVLMQLHRANPQAGFDLAALSASEQSRARTLLELLAEGRTDFRQGVDPSALEREQRLRALLTLKYDRLTRLLNKKHTPEEQAAAEKEIRQLTDEYRRTQAEIRQISPRYAALMQPQPLNAAEIQRLLDDDTVLLQFSLGEKNSYLWLVSPTSIVSHHLPPRTEIEHAARKVYELLTARQPKPGLTQTQQTERIRTAEIEFSAQAATLSQMLLAPVAAQLGNKRLAIVASGVLEYLPFGVLPEPQAAAPPQAKPLIVQHEIVNLPSASVLAVLRRDAASRQPMTKSVAVLADPVFAANDPRVAAIPQPDKSQSVAATAVGVGERGDLARLPFSREEADTILSFAPHGKNFKALSFAANRTTATSAELAQYRIVHFATHGFLNSEHPELSGLAFSLVNEAGKPQDGFLRLHEIFNLRLPADLVVLSACQTALGQQIKGEGLIGLTRGFMHAGTPRVVASLWQVNDLATAELMKLFYRGMLKDGQRPAAALRNAQLELMKQRRWASPYFWAAFTLQGEWK
ncbi:MAG: CHAT domain-containing protein [Acidobacteria bacterium]|nr:CHAT domain-containing protein [Acidobacteriota bacterium]